MFASTHRCATGIQQVSFQIKLILSFFTSFPFLGLDILWTGCPVVTKATESFGSRVAAGQMDCLGLPELIAKTEEEYVKLAVRLGNDPSYRKEMRDKVWKQRTESDLFSVDNYALNFERVFFKMAEKYEVYREKKLKNILAEMEREKTVESVLKFINTQIDEDYIDLEE